MGYLDLIRELRSGEPNVKKAAKAMKYLGWGCFLAGLWNYILPQLSFFKESGFHFPESYANLLLTGLFVIGCLFLLSARGMEEMEPWGKRAGQSAIGLLLLGLCIAFFLMIPVFEPFHAGDPASTIFFSFFCVLVLAQFGPLAFYGIRYLDRLPVRDGTYGTAPYHRGKATRPISGRRNVGKVRRTSETKYKDSPFPFGIMGTFPLLIAVPLLLFFVTEEYWGPEVIGPLFAVFMLFFFVAPTIFNYISSPFQENRRLLASFNGGGSVFLFHGSWPFFRLMVYEDALEVRVMFHRFLIPYDKMEEIPRKIGFFSSGILIKSDLSGVPSRIRFSGFGMKKILKIVCGARDKFMSQSRKTLS